MEIQNKQYFVDLFFRGNEEILELSPVKKLIARFEDLQKDLQMAQEENAPTYCPTCSSCGEEGCCSPDNCEAVKCLYEQSNLRSYYEAQMENSILWEFLDLISEAEKNHILQKQSLKEWADEYKAKIHKAWEQEYGDLEKFYKKQIQQPNDRKTTTA